MKKQAIGALVLSGVLLLSGCGQARTPESSNIDSMPESSGIDSSPESSSIDSTPESGGIDSSPESGGIDSSPESGSIDSTPESGSPDSSSEPDSTDNTASVSKRDAIPFEEGQLYAAAYLGYQTTEELDYYAERYLDSSALPTYYISSGDYYLVIPRYDNTVVSLYVNDIETSLSSLLFQDPDCGPFLIQCNASDIFTDITVILEHGGETAEFSPFISLKDGSLSIGEGGLDLTKS